jgi:hypothetical protein
LPGESGVGSAAVISVDFWEASLRLVPPRVAVRFGAK